MPCTQDGCDLLKRLEYAFWRGLLFTVGVSLTSGKHNRAVWSSIHHKTRLIGGAHGYPDPGYIIQCNLDLNAVGVPQASDLAYV